MTMIGTNWTAVGGVAQLVAAVATMGLAVVTARMAMRTHEVAVEAKAQAGAAAREAKATENLAIEARTDRQLAWRPHLELVGYDHHTDVEDNSFYFTVRNLGPGPALQVDCLAREIENVARWGIARIGDLRSGDSGAAHGQIWSKGGSLNTPFEGIPGESPGGIVAVVLMCSDVLGRRFRFGYTRPIKLPPSDQSLRALPADVSVISEDHPAHTGWADEPLIWG
jgi:hypothetical protein